jgi:hypothetical protein
MNILIGLVVAVRNLKERTGFPTRGSDFADQ